MKRLLLIMLALAFPAQALAQASTSMGAVRTTAPTYVNGETRPLSLDLSGNLRVTTTPAGGSPTSAQGASSTGQLNSLSGCATTTNPPTYVTGTTNPLSCDTAGNLRGATILSPSGAASYSLSPVVTTAVASSLVLKASAGNLYSWQVTTGATAGYVLIFNAASAPADGAVTPQQCVVVAANTTVGATFDNMPDRYSTGITMVFSSTGCFTKTASATAFMRGRAF